MSIWPKGPSRRHILKGERQWDKYSTGAYPNHEVWKVLRKEQTRKEASGLASDKPNHLATAADYA